MTVRYKNREPMGTGWKITRPTHLPAGARGVSSDEESKLIKSNWIADRATPSAPKSSAPIKFTAPVAPKSSAPIKFTTSAAPSGVPKPKMPRPMATTKQGAEATQRYISQAFREEFPDLGEGFDVTPTKEQSTRILNRANELERQATPTRMHTPTMSAGLKIKEFGPDNSSAVRFEIPKLESPGVGAGAATPYVGAAAAVGVAYKTGAHKLPIAVAKAPFKIAKAAYRLGRTGSIKAAPKPSSVGGAMPASSNQALKAYAGTPSPQAAPKAPAINQALKAYAGMPAASTAGKVNKPTSKPAPVKPASTATPPIAAAPPGAAMPKASTVAATPPAQTSKIDEAMNLARKIQGEKAAAEAANAGASEQKPKETIKTHPSGAELPRPQQTVPVGKKAREAASRTHAGQTLERFGVTPSAEAVSKIRADVPLRAAAPGTVKAATSAEAQLQSNMDKLAGKSVKVAPDVEVKVPTPSRLGSPEGLSRAFAATGSTGMPTPSAAAQAAPAKPPRTKQAPKMPEGVETPKPQAAAPTTPAEPPKPSTVGHTTFSPEQQRTADTMHRELSRLKNEHFANPESLEAKQAYDKAQGEAKDWLIKQGGVQREPDAPLQPPKPKTVTPPRPISSREKTRADLRVAAETKQKAESVRRAGAAEAANRLDPAHPYETPAGFKPGVETAPTDKPKMSNLRKAEDKKIRTASAAQEVRDRGLLGQLKDAITGDQLARRQARAEAATDIEDLITRPRQADKPMGVAARPIGSAAKPSSAIPFSSPRTKVTADVFPQTPRPATPSPSLDFLHTPGVRAAQLQEESGKKRSRAAKARKAEISRLQAEEATRAGLPPQPTPAQLRGEMGGISEQSQAERNAIKARAEAAERLRQTQVGGSAINETPDKALAREARKAQIEAHMKTKGYTRIETGLGEAHVVAGAEPKTTRIGPQAAPRGATAEGMPQASTEPTPATAAPKAPKVKRQRGKGAVPAGTEFPKPSTGAQPEAPANPEAAGATQGEAADKNPGRFRLGKKHGTGNTRGRKGGKGGGKGNIIIGAMFAAGAGAEAAQAAEPGQKVRAAFDAAKASSVAMGKDAAIAYGLGLASPALGLGYMGVQTARGLPSIKDLLGEATTEGARALGDWWAARKERQASEAKWGEAQYRAAISKQAANVYKKAKGLL